MKLLKYLLIFLLSASIALGCHHPSSASSFQLVPLVEGLVHPWSIAWISDQQMLITERPGRLRLVTDGKLDPDPIVGVPPVFAQGQGGLLEVSVHPAFAQNHLIYLTYAEGRQDANRTTIARGTLNGKVLENVETIFTVSQAKTGTQHFGSRMLWLPDQTMLVSIGDGGNPPLTLNGALIREQAQNLDSQLGKVLRLRDDGTIPPDNPFGNNPVWSYGHRNIQGLALDPNTGKIWSSEHGARGGDELNILEQGKNYGWPLVSYSREYATGEPVSPQQSQPGLVEPVKVWTPAIAPSGLAVSQGDLLIGGLVSRDIKRIRLNSRGEVISEETIPFPSRVRDVRVGPDGLVYVLTDAPDGQLIRLDFLQ